MCKTLVLVGLKGVGKTSLARKIHEKLGFAWIDSDREIEAEHAKAFGESLSCSEIFTKYGEPYFRSIESQVVDCLHVKADESRVISLGGGGVLLEKNRQSIAKLGTLLCLHLSKEELLKRWGKWPSVCKSREEFDHYYDERVRLLQLLPAIWLDAAREDLYEEVIRYG